MFPLSIATNFDWKTLSVDNYFDECTLSHEKRVPTDRQTLSMHQYVLIESHRKASIALWVHPLSLLHGLWGKTDRPKVERVAEAVRPLLKAETHREIRLKLLSK